MHSQSDADVEVGQAGHRLCPLALAVLAEDGFGSLEGFFRPARVLYECPQCCIPLGKKVGDAAIRTACGRSPRLSRPSSFVGVRMLQRVGAGDAALRCKGG